MLQLEAHFLNIFTSSVRGQNAKACMRIRLGMTATKNGCWIAFFFSFSKWKFMLEAVKCRTTTSNEA